MADKNRSEDFAQGKQRLEDIGHRLGGLFGKSGAGGGALFAGLGTLIDQLGKLAEQAQQAQGERTGGGEFDVGPDKRMKGVYGFTVKSGIGDRGVKVEPFGNIRRNEERGPVVVQEIREPMVDVIDEPEHVLVVAEVPGIRKEDVHLELREDVLILSAASGDTKYGKEVLLPAGFSSDQMSFSCRNGILEIHLNKSKAGS